MQHHCSSCRSFSHANTSTLYCTRAASLLLLPTHTPVSSSVIPFHTLRFFCASASESKVRCKEDFSQLNRPWCFSNSLHAWNKFSSACLSDSLHTLLCTLRIQCTLPAVQCYFQASSILKIALTPSGGTRGACRWRNWQTARRVRGPRSAWWSDRAPLPLAGDLGGGAVPLRACTMCVREGGWSK